MRHLLITILLGHLSTHLWHRSKIKLVLCSKVVLDGGILHNTRNHATISYKSIFFLSTLNEWLLLTNYLLVRADQNTNYSCKRPHFVIVFVRAFCLVFTFLDLWLPWSVSHSVLYLFRMLGLILHFICLGLGSSKSVEVYCSSSVFQSQPSFAALLRLFIFFVCVDSSVTDGKNKQST